MSFVKFFIDRPVFSTVLSILILIAGLVSLKQLPLAEYPQVTPPTVVVRAFYPGANPEVIAETVAAPLEQEINGVEGMLYMTSHASSDGRLSLTITFSQETNHEDAQIAVQNRVSRATPRLPMEVQRLGIVTQKTSPDMLMVVHLVSPDESMKVLDLYNFALLKVKDELLRLPGVSDVIVWGAGEYSMRVWLNPDSMYARGLSSSEVVAAIREQNVQVAAGSIGQPPHDYSNFQLSLNANGRLSTPEEFEQLIVKVGENGALVRLKDVARVEIGANRYAIRSLLNNEEAAGIQIVQAPEANAIETANQVRQKMAELRKEFPSSIEYRIAYDPTIFVQSSIDNVLTTLLEAVVLVVIVVFLFLKTWRASIIPLLAVPVSLIGTFAVMHAFGFSLNTLSLFGLVLSIGIVVDDAIVVVENVERHLRSGLKPKEAAYAAMQEVTGPIIAITIVLAAVFIPTAFLSGLTGQFYSQFALTIAISSVISAINSLTLSPALSALLLKDQIDHRKNNNLLSGFLESFDKAFNKVSKKYRLLVTKTIRLGFISGAFYLVLLIFTGIGFSLTPAGFVPSQDKYYLVGIAQLPAGSSLDRTEKVVKDLTDIALSEPGVENVVAFPGLSINGFVSNPASAVFFIMLDPFESRKEEALSANNIAMTLNKKAYSLSDAFIGIFPPPPVPGLGNTGGFKMQVQDREGKGYQALSDATWSLIAAANQDPRLTGLYSSFQANVPQIDLEIDRSKAKMIGVPLNNLYETLQTYLGSTYVNDFSMLGKNYQVYAQSDADFRKNPEDIKRLFTKNAKGEMVPVSSLVQIRYGEGPDPVVRHNAYAAAEINGSPANGVSTGEAIAIMEELAKQHLPEGFDFEWTEITYQQIEAGDTANFIFPLAVLLALLILAALYNSWSLPFAVILIIPSVLFSSLIGVWISSGDNNIFTQIGFLVLVGLASKNSILIVEFARQKELSGASPLRAVLDAAKQRFRPILMTSIAFIMGVLPLVFSSGAGAEMRYAMGIAVLYGMLGVTIFGLIFTPFIYLAIRKINFSFLTKSKTQFFNIKETSHA